MTPKEKFENVLHNWIDKDYNRQHVATELETYAEEFAIEFGQWLLNQPYRVKYNDKKELLEMYKKHYETKNNK
jgi:hypothetical protein